MRHGQEECELGAGVGHTHGGPAQVLEMLSTLRAANPDLVYGVFAEAGPRARARSRSARTVPRLDSRPPCHSLVAIIVCPGVD